MKRYRTVQVRILLCKFTNVYSKPKIEYAQKGRHHMSFNDQFQGFERLCSKPLTILTDDCAELADFPALRENNGRIDKPISL